MRSSTNLDTLRSTAVLAVYVAHLSYCLYGTDFAGFGFFEAIGRFGVILFFLHTSLVLMMSINRTAS